MKLRCAFIGLGSAGSMHLKAASETSGVKVSAVCDVDEDRARAVAANYGVSTATDYRKVVTDPNVDAVIVGSPDQYHRDHTVAALEAGKHVLCEKPMAPTEGECQDMVDAADRSGRTLMIGHFVRFTPVFAAMKSIADDGVLGDIFYVGADYQHDYGRLAGTWRFDPVLGRHTYLGGGCHAVDLARWFLNECVSVTAMANHMALPQLPTDDCMIATYATETGQLARVFVAAGCQRPYQLGLEVYGTKGTVIATNVDKELKLWVKELSKFGDDWMTVPVKAQETHPARRQLEQFVECVRSGQRPLVDGREGMRTVQIAIAAVAASTSGTTIPIPGPLARTG